jgi:hypothetical protein
MDTLVDRVIRSREQRLAEEAENRKIAQAWLESDERHHAKRVEELWWARLHHARAMRRSHTKTFAELDAKWTQEIERCESRLGLNNDEVA